MQLGGGEREGRVLSSLVSSRHYGFSHGIGRSGDLTAQQPKAIGSSLLQRLTTALTQHALQLAGLTSATDCLLMPVATGMTVTVALMALQRERESRSEADQLSLARYVVMPRIDQKTCIKCVTAAGLQPSVVQLAVDDQSDALVTDVAAIERRIDELGGPDSVLCVLSVTSCFAPRGADDVVGLAVLCERLGVAHVVNNAYGVQSRRVMEAIDRAGRRGRVDAVVQSMDKNFMVPVGGAVVCRVADGQHRSALSSQSAAAQSTAAAASTAASSSLVPSSASASPSRPSLVALMSRLYPGRASSSSIADLLITLLTVGERGWLALLSDRTLLFERLRQSLQQLAVRHHERLLHTSDRNDISVALTVTLPAASSEPSSSSSLSMLGSMLYRRGVSGMRVWQAGAASAFPGLPLDSWGGHGWHTTIHASSGSGYVSMACAVGMGQHELEAVVDKLDATLTEWKRKMLRSRTTSEQRAKDDPEAVVDIGG